MAPIIDRKEISSLKPGRFGSRPILAVTIVIVLMIGAAAGLMIRIGDNGESLAPDVPAGEPPRILFTTHAPILISDNGGFTNASGVVWGSGTASDPYIIADWQINASSAHGIEIMGTDAYFVITTCYIHDGEMGSYYGVRLEDVSNGTVIDNMLSKNMFGLRLHSSNNITIRDNLCTNNRIGAFIQNSDWNVMDNNTCTLNFEGIVLDDGSDGNIVSNNNCSGNSDDCIFVDNAKNNTVAGNNCSNSNYGIIVTESSWNNTLVSNICSSNNYDGMYLYKSSNNTLDSNNCSSNGNWGIQIDWSTSNVLLRNQLCGNLQYGVYIYSTSTSNVIFNNTFVGNNGAGSTYDPDHAQAYDEVPGNWWNSTDGYGNYWSDWTSPDDVPPYGIVDLPYEIGGDAGAKDNFPLTTMPEPIPEFGSSLVLLSVVILIATIVIGLMRVSEKRP
jgi:parallel beta-helix repeat protein